MSFGSVLRNRRHQMEISLSDLARRCGITKGYLSRVERDQERPPHDDELISKFAAILGIPMDELFIEAKRLPPDMTANISDVVSLYRRESSKHAKRHFVFQATESCTCCLPKVSILSKRSPAIGACL